MADGPSPDGPTKTPCPFAVRRGSEKYRALCYPPTLHRAEGNLTGNHFSLPVEPGRHASRQLTINFGELALRAGNNGRLTVIQIFTQIDVQRQLGQQLSGGIASASFSAPPVPKIGS
ncbi:Uncharacterised protein [Raoultella planticola]|uniref:Uncharacterized protein n=1 Tax=Raoultella planticola TaxID=575 RepID=A0A485AAC4_RAOPL|nr:Uncharacterised protein [Raoultella planticola]